MIIYKIRDKDSKLFTSGGLWPVWSKRGKNWNNIGYVKTHLRQHINREGAEFYKNAEIVAVEVTEDLASVCTAKSILEPMIKEELEHLKSKYKGQKLSTWQRHYVDQYTAALHELE